jgi:hypothetical protein
VIIVPNTHNCPIVFDQLALSCGSSVKIAESSDLDVVKFQLLPRIYVLITLEIFPSSKDIVDTISPNFWETDQYSLINGPAILWLYNRTGSRIGNDLTVNVSCQNWGMINSMTFILT